MHAPLDGRWFPNNPEIRNVHSFLIKTDKPSIGLDVRLRNTVLDILTNFLRGNDAIIVYYCDPFDGKGYKRYLKFNRWFDVINDPSIEKQDGEFTVTDLRIDENDHLIRSELTVYASILVRKTHPDYDAVIRLFHSGDMDKTGKL
ncbi:hypothetical protein J2Y45_001611 [Dyadobacter sp. BE34]|uniref:Uncharacterized protein n=1 Tax=Dyadobacter fermentans TaxID=94254 RepID=A0ABU1QT63_9BACT|nr:MULTISPECIES: DUF6169 family protein [Dyadobacter]MDR6804342.1 hypothetical protein [Dyadobacter fermentans]MDR7042082.1 hypothetical protein [Dyadobacter sp. BE242]MDR7196485.1 hypothetical protein [Dyadobacter sp. BE34]MDR7212970.1 hypothetical protein [Dyadobacter sp. BE31]MDR7261891.1 hypothetical protein [Dyadobacter sp. BE32]